MKGPRLSEADEQKFDRILTACQDHNLELLAELASSEGGLIEDHSRRIACKHPWPVINLYALTNFSSGPLLLGCEQSQGAWEQHWSTLQRHRDEEQVELDVNRSFVYYPESKRRDMSWRIGGFN